MTIGFAGRRAGSMILVLVALTAAVFLLENYSPADPVQIMLGLHAPASAVNAERKKLGYDKPLPVRFARYVEHALTGDLGTSLRTGQPVLSDLGTYLPASLELVMFSMLISIPMTLLFAISSAARWPGANLLRLGLLSLAAAPPFFVAIGGILIFYKQLGWLPPSGRTSLLNAPSGPTGLLTIDGILHGNPSVAIDALRHVVLPALALSLLPAVTIGRVLRSSIIEALRSDYVRAARSRGLGEWQIVIRHCLRNSAGPTLAMSGLMVGFLFGGLTIIEPIFGWPGVGSYVYEAISRDDFPAIAGVTLLLGATYVVVNTLVDLLQAAADPRIQL